MSKEMDLSRPTVSIVVKSVSMHMKTHHPCVVTLNEMLSLTVMQDFAHDFIRKLMFCSTNFVTTSPSALGKCRLVC